MCECVRACAFVRTFVLVFTLTQVGAGHALVSVLIASLGAAHVVATDYSEEVLRAYVHVRISLLQSARCRALVALSVADSRS